MCEGESATETKRERKSKNFVPQQPTLPSANQARPLLYRHTRDLLHKVR